LLLYVLLLLLLCLSPLGSRQIIFPCLLLEHGILMLFRIFCISSIHRFKKKEMRTHGKYILVPREQTPWRTDLSIMNPMNTMLLMPTQHTNTGSGHERDASRSTFGELPIRPGPCDVSFTSTGHICKG